jgi:hypothetical protein
MTDIYLDNSYTVRHAWTGDNLTTGEREPATGLTVTAFLSAAQAAPTAIHADLSITLDEVGTTGEYIGVISGDAIAARLGAFVGQVVYEVVTDGATARFATPMRVRRVRAA